MPVNVLCLDTSRTEIPRSIQNINQARKLIIFNIRCTKMIMYLCTSLYDFSMYHIWVSYMILFFYFSSLSDCMIFLFLGIGLFNCEILNPNHWSWQLILWTLLLCLLYRFIGQLFSCQFNQILVSSSHTNGYSWSTPCSQIHFKTRCFNVKYSKTRL